MLSGAVSPRFSELIIQPLQWKRQRRSRPNSPANGYRDGRSGVSIHQRFGCSQRCGLGIPLLNVQKVIDAVLCLCRKRTDSRGRPSGRQGGRERRISKNWCRLKRASLRESRFTTESANADRYGHRDAPVYPQTVYRTHRHTLRATDTVERRILIDGRIDKSRRLTVPSLRQ